MTLAISWALSAATGAQTSPCPIRIRMATSFEARIKMTACCSETFDLCILQGADKTFTLTDAATADYSDATEVEFSTWRGGSQTLSYTATGGDITQPTDYQFTFSIPNADSETLAGGRHDAEIWVTFSDGTRVGSKGILTVQDTRNFD